MKKILYIVGVLILYSNIYALENGTYSIVSKYSGECLTFENLKNNSKLIQSECRNLKEQEFEITNIEENIYYISNIAIGNKNKSNNVQFFKNPDQKDRFKIEDDPNGFKIKNIHTEKYITLIPYTNRIVQYNSHNGSEQNWKFVNINSNEPDIPENTLFGKKVRKLVFQPLQSNNNTSDQTEVYNENGILIQSKSGWRQNHGYSINGQLFDFTENPVFISNIKYTKFGDSGNSLYKVYYTDNTVGIFGDTHCDSSSWQGYKSSGFLADGDNIDKFKKENLITLKYKEYPISEDFNVGYIGCPDLP